MELREDMYSIAFLYKLKRMTLFGDGVEDLKRTESTTDITKTEGEENRKEGEE